MVSSKRASYYDDHALSEAESNAESNAESETESNAESNAERYAERYAEREEGVTGVSLRLSPNSSFPHAYVSLIF